MKNIFFLFGLVCSLLSLAQPVITSSITPTKGQSFQFMDFDSTKHEPGNSGPNQTWDFSKIEMYDTVTLAFLEPKDTPYGYMFPEANMAMTADKIDYNYFNFSASKYTVIGDMGVNADYKQFSITTYSKPETMLEFPVKYGNTFSNENDRIVDYPGEVTIYQHNTTSYTADAWGTLVLPFGKFENALRIKTVELFEDSMTDGKRFMLQIQEGIKYQWFIPGVTAPVVSITKTLVGGGVDDEEKDTMYSNTVAVVMKEHLLENRALFPLDLKVVSLQENKAEICFNLPKQERVSVLIIDNSGKTVRKFPEEKKESGQQKLEFDTSGLASGVYLISIETKSAKESIRWIKR